MQVNSPPKFQVNVLKVFEIQRMFFSESIIFAFVQYAMPLTNGKGSASWGILITLFLVSLTTLFFSNGEKERFSRTFYCSAIPIIIVGTWTFRLPMFEIILLFIFSFWRLKLLYGEECIEDSDNFFSSRLLLTILVFVFMYLVEFVSGMKSVNLLVVFLFLQFLLFAYGTFFKRFIQNKNIDKKAFFRFGFYLFLFPIFFALIIAFFIGSIKHELSFVFDNVFWYFVKLINPILEFIINILHMFSSKLGGSQRQDMIHRARIEEIPEKFNSFFGHQEGSIYIMIGIVVIVIIAIWIVLHLMKGKVKMEDTRDNELQQTVFYNIIDSQNRKGNHTSYYTKSTQRIRKSVQELEHFAAKHSLERRGSESVRDWLDRFNIQTTEKWLSIYENVRYGFAHVSQEDVIDFEKEMKEIKNCIKKLNENE
ncbi:hypothetical protein H5P36_02685 [Bacillus sp. APMAM]|uniref:hypothetical protein n=1 Tax=Margalitia sp. FSL K6-0131 TaxID=2954604 RepID=UPI000F8685A2|nr:hypothetical protein [Bacillus sp. APMAM]RTZ57212.1 hypothetical protein EKO25_03110 [Bacillus sp. SAJ1]